MAKDVLFHQDPEIAARPSKTDRLVLLRLLKQAAMEKALDEEAISAAHEVLIHWADLESSGRLARFKETQMQGKFLDEVFHKALGYQGFVDGVEEWRYEQHYSIASQTPDAVLGHFRQGADKELLGVVELKGPTVHLDRDRSSGRTAVDQCWDYLVNTPAECRWGIGFENTACESA